MGAHLLPGPGQLPRQRPVEDLVDQRALAGTRDAGHGDEGAERKPDVHVLQVVLTRAPHDEVLAVAVAFFWGCDTLNDAVPPISIGGGVFGLNGSDGAVLTGEFSATGKTAGTDAFGVFSGSAELKDGPIRVLPLERFLVSLADGDSLG